MRNGKYILVKAPENYPGKRYRDKYCYEHILVYWQNTGVIPGPDELIHHKDDNKHNNNFLNLELITRVEHGRLHGKRQGKKFVTLICPGCNKPFERAKADTHLGQKRKKATYCSRACIGRKAYDYSQYSGPVEEFRKYDST